VPGLHGGPWSVSEYDWNLHLINRSLKMLQKHGYPVPVEVKDKIRDCQKNLDKMERSGGPQSGSPNGPYTTPPQDCG